jgi:5-methyltetrahydrofolate--homocysteine methyltransferase
MGTQLFARGLQPGECGMAWNERHRADVFAVHEAYVRAGCRVITTNSFGGTRTMLERHGQGANTTSWNRLAAELARDAVGPKGWVLGDIGPFGDFLEPLGEMTEPDLTAIFQEQMSALLEGGADALLVETMSDPAEAVVAIGAAKSLGPVPVFATYAFQKTGGEFRTMMGTSVEQAISEALRAGADVVGGNCGTDLSLQDYLELAAVLRSFACDTPVLLQPNAGSPKQGPDGIYYDATPEEMATAAVRLRDAGVTLLGGCCGTSPAHLQAMATAIR